MKITIVQAKTLLKLNQQGLTIEQAVAKINQLSELSDRLKAGKAAFAYKKTNGETRYAIGTTCLDLIPNDSLPKHGSEKRCGDGNQRYFDFTCNDWRCFARTNLLEII